MPPQKLGFAKPSLAHKPKPSQTPLERDTQMKTSTKVFSGMQNSKIPFKKSYLAP